MAAKNVIRFLRSTKVSFSSFDKRASGAWYVSAAQRGRSCAHAARFIRHSEFYRQMAAEKVRTRQCLLQ